MLKFFNLFKTKKTIFFRYTVEIFNNDNNSKPILATYTSKKDYFTLAGSNRVVVVKNKLLKATIKKIIKKEEIYV
jgi:hypothetical protein